MPDASQKTADTARTRPDSLKLDDKAVRDAIPPSRGNRIRYDARLPGFGLRITAAGNRSFVFNYRVKGRERRITIGHYPTWTVLAARKQAEQLRRQIDLGFDPLEERITVRAAPKCDSSSSDMLKSTYPQRLRGRLLMIGQCGETTFCPRSEQRRLRICGGRTATIFTERSAEHGPREQTESTRCSAKP